MKDKASTVLMSIKTNKEIVNILKSSRKFNLPYTTIWLGKQTNRSRIDYALLVNKSQFKLAVTRNKVKRQLRNILITSELKGGIKLLIKPNATFLKRDYNEVKTSIINTISKYQNGK